MNPILKIKCLRILFQVFLLVSLSIIFSCFFNDNDDDDGSTIEDNEPLNDIERVSFAFDRSETDGDSWDYRDVHKYINNISKFDEMKNNNQFSCHRLLSKWK